MGRTCKGIDPQKRILLKYPLVSRKHAEINWTAGHLQITDTSINGTWVNDVRMAAGSSKELSDGDTIRIGYSLLRVVYPKVVADAKQNHTETQLTMVSSLEEVVTILVADVRGFSAYCQTHASADVYGMINQIFDQFSKIIEDFKGTVKDYAGDSVMAFWEHQFGDSTRQSVLACLAAIQQMLEGFDESWSAPASFRRATYTNLPAGSYNFLVQASNNFGVWNEQGVSMRLRVVPPPWRSSWAYAAYLFLVLAAVYSYVRIQRRQLASETRQREHLEEQVTATHRRTGRAQRATPGCK